MKILILNQHTSNHGDEAAGKSLIKELLLKGVSEQNISIFYNAYKFAENEKIYPDKIERHYFSKKLDYTEKIFLILSFFLPFKYVKKLLNFAPNLKYEYEIIKSNDVVVNAPGGVNIGPYKDWRYLWRLYVSLKLNKPTYIYSISFGPLPKNIFFKKKSIFVLKNVRFLSLRDKQSQRLAQKLSIKYVPSIDTVFLNNLDTFQINNLDLKDYIVFVPNQLYKWHPNFKHINPNKLDNIYLKILDFFIKKGYHIVMMPQLFGQGNDVDYFKYLAQKFSDTKKIKIINPDYSAEYQLDIVSKSKCVIGARYHSIIFAILKEKPFLSLSYENKMKNTLEILGLDKYNIDIDNLITNSRTLQNTLEDFKSNLISQEDKVKLAKNKAIEIAKNTFKKFYEDLEGILNEKNRSNNC